jgi:Ca2+-binding RTX toxin-like protein
MLGQDGNDTLDGGVGTDTLIGGLGDDLYEIDLSGSNDPDMVNESPNEGVDLVKIKTVGLGALSYPLPANVENLIRVSGVGALELIGNAIDNRLEGSSGRETLDGGFGNDTLVGASGIDTFIVSSGVDQISDLGRGGADVLVVDSGATATATIVAAWTAPSASVNNGNAMLSTAGFAVDLRNVFSGLGFHVTNTSKAQRFYGSNLEDTLTGGAGNDTLFGWSGNDTLMGNQGADRFEITDGIDTVVDLGGADVFAVAKAGTGRLQLASAYTAKASSSNAGTVEIFANGFNANFSALSLGNGYTFDNKALSGAVSSTAVTLVGSGLDDRLYGGKSDDVLIGGAGDDYFSSRNGSDLMDGGAGSDLFLFNPIEDSSGDTIAGGAGVDTLEIKNGAANVKGLSAGSNISGIETLILNEASSLTAWADLIAKNPSLTTVRGTEGGVSETLTLASSAAKNWSVQGDTLSIAQLLVLVDATVIVEGSAFNDYLIGSRESDKLNGNNGDDTINGGKGVDSVDGGNGNDTIVLTAGVDSGAETLDGGGGNDTLSINGNVSYLNSNVVLRNVEIIALEAGASFSIGARYFGFALEGNTSQAPNSLFEIRGTAGGDDENVVFTNDSDQGFTGMNSVFTLAAVKVDANTIAGIDFNNFVGNVKIAGSEGRDSIRGGGGNDTIGGGAGNDTIFGGEGRDTIAGDDGNDTITGGMGMDTLTGGSGNDVFNFTESASGGEAPVSFVDVETITDFAPLYDKLDLPGSATHAEHVAPTSQPIENLNSYYNTPNSSKANKADQASLQDGIVKVFDDGVPFDPGSTHTGHVPWNLFDWVFVTRAMVSTSNRVAAFEFANATYVFYENAEAESVEDDLLIKLDVTGITSISQVNALSNQLLII